MKPVDFADYQSKPCSQCGGEKVVKTLCVIKAEIGNNFTAHELTCRHCGDFEQIFVEIEESENELF